MSGDSAYRTKEDFRAALRGVWFSPRRFFRNLDPEGGTIGPAIFASLVVYLALLLEAALQAVWIREFDPSLLYALLFGLVVAVVLGPLLVASLTTLVLVVLDGAPSRAKFSPLFRSLGYACGVLILLPIPYAPFLVLLYGPYVATLAVKETLVTSWRRAAVGALIPVATLLLILLALLGPGDAYELLVNPPGS
ncbi:MAG: YIP1 family protein [Actinomycetota bacterium]|nr:YIP1 family protein [Actinomycetota bacterium]